MSQVALILNLLTGFLVKNVQLTQSNKLTFSLNLMLLIIRGNICNLGKTEEGRFACYATLT